ncbi:hypothetical protein Dda_2689 [Drechslerella dactyloides]|uniref:SH3 domain-containing protein n=1 Tax=Drechslerella dactyloides TaxID=74499 RepID=A0AAD6J020_DREDA|nr:hypothetical protein Dda_2689 [Drechslerella dactyloides]
MRLTDSLAASAVAIPSRTDTIDLQQDQDHPSAKDHSNGVATKAGSIAPSQANALMNVAQEQAHEQHDLMTVHTSNGTRVNGEATNGDSYIPDSISPYNHEPEYANGHDDDAHDEDDMDEEMLDRMSSSPSISDEDIDFEFVYALHTFIATVEGQANATKGDTMVLLDDSNSYWWLVRVVKDSSIGYLPAEHIETPSERLARLNKHRNVDVRTPSARDIEKMMLTKLSLQLSTPMLGDNQEKSKNILKKAIKRRGAKTVQFAPPTYFEPSDVEYSTDEEDDEGGYYSNEDEGAALDDEDALADTKSLGGSTIVEDDEITPMEAPDTSDRARLPDEKSKDGQKKDDKSQAKSKAEVRKSEDIFETEKVDASTAAENKPKPSPIRNTDSAFFGDADSEPRRITLTPKLVRDDDITTAPSVVPVKPKTATDKSAGRREEVLSPPPSTTKNEKVKKEKKSILGSLFKKKKSNSKDEEIDEFLHSNEKKSDESLRGESGGRTNGTKNGNAVEQSPQLQQRAQQNEKLLQNPQHQHQQPKKAPEPVVSAPKILKNAPIRTIDSVREVDEEDDERPLGMKFATRIPPIDQQQSTVVAAPEGTSTKQPQPQPQPSQQQQQHILPSAAPAALQQVMHAEASPASIQSPASKPRPESDEADPVVTYTDHVDGRPDGYYSDSPEDLTPHELPSLIPDNGSGSEDNGPLDTSPTEAAYPDTLVAHPGSPAELVWSEAALRTYLDDDNRDIRDFLVVVNHRTEAPAVKTHPVITPLFADANSRLKDMTMEVPAVDSPSFYD